jgi:hypothetical protein
MSFDTICKEISEFIASKVNHDEIVNCDLLVHEIVESRAGIIGPDADFYRICTCKIVYDVAKSCIAKYNSKDLPTRQLALPGFEYLQVAYPVKRNGVKLLVPVNQMTDDELEERANEYDAMSRGCRDHAREIRGYVSKRNAANDNAPTEPAIAA